MDRIANRNRRIRFESLEKRFLLCHPFPTYPFGGLQLLTNQFGDTSYYVSNPDSTDLFKVRLGNPGTYATFSTSGSADTTLAYYGEQSCPDIVNYNSGSGNNASISTNTPDYSVFEAGVVGLAVLTEDSTPYTVHVDSSSPSSSRLNVSSTSRFGEDQFSPPSGEGEALWVRFTTTHTGTWTVSAESEYDYDDMAVSLFDGSGNALQTWVNEVGAGGTETLSASVAANSTLYLRIDPAEGYYQLNDNILVNVQGPSPFGTFPLSNMQIVPTDRYGDTYDFGGSSGITNYLVLSNATGETSISSNYSYDIQQIAIYTADGEPSQVVNVDDSAYEIAGVEQTANSPLGLAVSADSSYDLNIDGPNQIVDSLAIDSTLLFGEALNQSLNTRYGVRWYEFTPVDTSQDWLIEVIPHGNLDVALTLFEGDNPLDYALDSGGPGQTESYNVSSYSDSYYLRVDSQGRSAGTFDIKVSGPNPFEYYFAYNDPQAIRVHTNQYGQALMTGLGGGSGTIHDYLIPSNAPGGGTATFRTSGSPSVLALMGSEYSYVEWYDDDNGTRVAPEIVANNSSSSTWNAAVAASGTYSLEIDLPAQAVESLEIGANGKAESEEYLDGPHDVRWYTFTANVSGEWDIEVDAGSGQDLSLLAFDAAGNRLNASPVDETGNGGIENLTLSLSDGEEVYFRVDSASGGYYYDDDSGDFDLRVISPRSTIQIEVDVLTAPFLILDAASANIELAIDWVTQLAEQESLEVSLLRLDDQAPTDVYAEALIQSHELDGQGTQYIEYPIEVFRQALKFVHDLNESDSINNVPPESQYRIRFRALDPDQNPTLMGVSIDNVMIRSSRFFPTGDYNRDLVVGLADYTIWRNSLGSQDDLRADGDADGVIDQDDYVVWKSAFGQVSEHEPLFQFNSSDVVPAGWTTSGQGGTWSQQDGKMQFALDVSVSNLAPLAEFLTAVGEPALASVIDGSSTVLSSKEDGDPSTANESARASLLLRRNPLLEGGEQAVGPLTNGESESGDAIEESVAGLDAAFEGLFADLEPGI